MEHLTLDVILEEQEKMEKSGEGYNLDLENIQKILILQKLEFTQFLYY